MPQILKDLKTGIGRIEFELDEEEYAAMGRVTAQWAYLEHAIFAVTRTITESLGTELPKDSLNMSFTRRLGALRTLVEEHAIETERKRIARLIGQIANAEQDRHKMTHALWEWDPVSPERLYASSFRPRFEFEKRFDAPALHDLADRLSRINFALQYPGGWDSAFIEALKASSDAEGNVAYGSVSRKFARMVLPATKAPQPTEK